MVKIAILCGGYVAGMTDQDCDFVWCELRLSYCVVGMISQDCCNDSGNLFLRLLLLGFLYLMVVIIGQDCYCTAVW